MQYFSSMFDDVRTMNKRQVTELSQKIAPLWFHALVSIVLANFMSHCNDRPPFLLSPFVCASGILDKNYYYTQQLKTLV